MRCFVPRRGSSNTTGSGGQHIASPLGIEHSACSGLSSLHCKCFANASLKSCGCCGFGNSSCASVSCDEMESDRNRKDSTVENNIEGSDKWCEGLRVYSQKVGATDRAQLAAIKEDSENLRGTYSSRLLMLRLNR